MNKRNPIGFIILGIIVVGLTIMSYYFIIEKQNLPIFSPADVNAELVDPEVRKGGSHYIADFKLTDQKGNELVSDWLDDKIYVADFFFTTCQTICPKMTTQMSAVAEAYEGDDDIRLLSFTVLPEIDTPEILGTYAEVNGVNYDQWRMLTGPKSKIYELARKSYFTLKEAEVGQGDGGDSDFIHTNNFVLVDGKGRIRGYYDGTSIAETEKLIDDIKILKRKN